MRSRHLGLHVPPGTSTEPLGEDPPDATGCRHGGGGRSRALARAWGGDSSAPTRLTRAAAFSPRSPVLTKPAASETSLRPESPHLPLVLIPC